MKTLTDYQASDIRDFLEVLRHYYIDLATGDDEEMADRYSAMALRVEQLQLVLK